MSRCKQGECEGRSLDSATIESIGMKHLKWHNSYLIVVFILVIAWIFIAFELVNISSGELKPRGLFVDENGINLHSSIFALVPSYEPRITIQASDEVNACSSHDKVCTEEGDLRFQCSSLSTTFSPATNNLHFNCLDYAQPHGHIQQITIDPLHSPKPLESTLLVFSLQPEQVSATQVYNLLGNIVFALNAARWQAKRVVVLLVPAETQALREQLVQSWIREQNETPLSAIAAESIVHVGMIRHAYVLDYVYLHPPAFTSTGALKVSKILCRHIGRSGMLPNMDMVAYLLIKFKGLVSIPFIIPAPLSAPYTPPNSSLLLSVMLKCMQDAKAFVNHPLFDTYIQRVYALVWTVREHVFGPADASGNGIQSALLAHNIDTVTLQPYRDELHARSNVYGLGDTLYEVIMQAVHMSNNLEEELHHSLFFYLVLDNNTFVGISEYGIPLALGLLSFVIMFVLLSNKLYSDFKAVHVALTAWLAVVVVFYACLASVSFSHALLFYLVVFPLTYAIMAVTV